MNKLGITIMVCNFEIINQEATPRFNMADPAQAFIVGCPSGLMLTIQPGLSLGKWVHYT